MNWPTAKPGRITATKPSSGNSDTTLPDPTNLAKYALLALTGLAFIVSVVMNALGWTGRAFVPAANFDLFAGFYLAAQAIERLLQLFAAYLPPWNPPSDPEEVVQAAYLKPTAGSFSSASRPSSASQRAAALASTCSPPSAFTPRTRSMHSSPA